MKSFDAIMIFVAILQLIVTGLLGWMVKVAHNLNREVGELKEKIIGIIALNEKESQVTDRRFDSKKDKD